MTVTRQVQGNVVRRITRVISSVGRFLGDNWKISVGLGVVLLIALVGLAGPHFRDTDMARMGGAPLNERPSLEYPLGTESTGRDMLALMIVATPNSFKVGLIAGAVGMVVGLTLGVITGYFRGPLDTIIRSFADIMMMIPSIAILIIIAATVRVISLESIGFIVAIFAWPRPTRLQ